ncbi:MAG: polysulfide reductase NrfD [Gemmatimonadetes bacterium]|nr:polysulfide reductase NrfD [Gemmatimonadota bacterium]
MRRPEARPARPLAREQDEALFRPILRTGPSFYAVAAALLAVALFGAYAYTTQLRSGLGVTGLNRPVFWGFYITNFVFFIGISHAGTLISAILRLSRAEWRRPITRMAETITVLVLFFGLGSVVVDLGRPDRAYFVIPFLMHGRLRSPLIWDVLSITTYLTVSSIYLYVPLIPDLALLRDRVAGWRHRLYRALALGWTGTHAQQRRLERVIALLAVIVIPIAVSVHTVVSWVFAMTIQPMWHSTIFGPYFVAGAIFSGIAALILAMALVRRIYHLESYIKPIHFDYLGILLLVMTLLWFYFTFAEYLTTFYGHEPEEMVVFWAKVRGPYAAFFWAMVLFDFVIPFGILANRRTRTVAGTVVASISVVIGMWLERFTIIVPTLVNPRLPWPQEAYAPSWVEVAITAAFFATFTLLYMVFTKLFPIVSIWEVKEGREKGLAEVEERIRGYLPAPEAEAAYVVR